MTPSPRPPIPQSQIDALATGIRARSMRAFAAALNRGMGVDAAAKVAQVPNRTAWRWSKALRAG